MHSKKERLDKILAARGLCESRAQAQALIMGGKVRVDGQVVTKPGALIAMAKDMPDAAGIQGGPGQDNSPAIKPRIEIEAPPPYVSRGGLKLEKALDVFRIAVAGRTAIDVGAATGGFTDCLLQRGAARVIAVDVGHGQLDWKLRQDPRVQVLEKTSIRTLQPAQLAAAPSLGVADASFISLKKVLPPLAALLAPEPVSKASNASAQCVIEQDSSLKQPAADAPNEHEKASPANETVVPEMIALLKPQFEHRDYLSDPGFKGVVRGEAQHQRIIEGVIGDLGRLLPDWRLMGLDFSPITGPKGNIEFLLHYRLRDTHKAPPPKCLLHADREECIRQIIAKSYKHNAFLSDPAARD